MNELYDRALDLFESNQFSEAYPLFLSIAKSEHVDFKLREKSYVYLLKCCSYENDLHVKPALEYDFSELLYKNQRYKEAYEIIKKYSENICGKKRKAPNSLMWKISYELGYIDVVEKYIENEIERISQKGDAQILKNLEREIRERGLSETLEQRVRALAGIIQGDYEVFNDFYDRLLKSKIQNTKESLLTSLVSDVSILPTGIRDEFYRSPEGKILLVFESLSKNELSILELKDVASNFFEAITLNAKRPIIEWVLCEYCLKSKRTDFVLLCEELLANNKKGIYKLRYQEKIRNAEKSYTPMRTIDQSEIDFGTDLFREDNKSGYDTAAKKEKMEREIIILRKSGKVKEAEKLIEELGKIDDEHPLVKDFNEGKISEFASRALKKRNGVEEIRDKLSNELSKFSKMVRNEETLSSDLSLLYFKNIEYMNDKDFKENQKDLILSSLTQGLPNVALSVLDDHRSEIPKDSLEYKYFKVTALISQGKEHEALDYLNEMLLSMTLIPEEKVTFLYIKAEILRSFGKRVEALKMYREVYKINPRYRLVKYRMSEIDQL